MGCRAGVLGDAGHAGREFPYDTRVFIIPRIDPGRTVQQPCHPGAEYPDPPGRTLNLYHLLGEEGEQHRRDEDTHGEEYPGREMGAEEVAHTEEPQVLKHVQPNEPGYHAVDH